MDLSVPKDKHTIDEAITVTLDDAAEKVLLENLDMRTFAAALVRIGIENWGATTILRLKSQTKNQTTGQWEDLYTPRATVNEDELSYVIDKHLFEQSKIGAVAFVNFLLQVGPTREARIVAFDPSGGGMIINRITVEPGPNL